MGFNFGLTGIPLIILALSTVMAVGSAGGLMAPGTRISICNPNSGAGQYQCSVSNTGVVTFTCTQTSGGCLIHLVPSCPSSGGDVLWNPPAFCTFLASGFAWFCPANSACTSTSGNTNTGGTLSTGSVNQGFAPLSSTTGFYIAILVVIVGLSVLAGFQVLGSGVSQEGVHILFMAGLLLGVWGILSTAEGFLTGNPNSFFAQLDLAAPYVGTGTYIILTLVYILGIGSAVSRGSSSA